MKRVVVSVLLSVLLALFLVAPAVAQTPTPVPEVTATPVAPEAPVTMDAAVIASLQANLTAIYQSLIPSVVNVQVAQETQFPFTQDSPFGSQGPQIQQALGSGFVWDTEGHIVTNNHVVAGADVIQVTFQDGTTVPAEVVGTDPDSDLAVIRVDVPADQLVPVQVADSTQVRVGQLAIAVGNPFGLQGSMTLGIVSAVGRLLPVQSTAGGSQYSVPDVIQTDAPINPGNSGGVLVDARGQLIGVPTSIISPAGVSAGVGFAVPSRIVQKVVPSLIETGTYQHPYMGITGTTLTPALAEAMDLPEGQRGALVIQVAPGGPAEQAGVQGSDQEVEVLGTAIPIGGDVIVAVDGEMIRSMDDLITFLSRNTEVGQTVQMTVLRDGEPLTLEATLQARPSQQQPQIPQMPQVPGPAGLRLGVVGVGLTPELAQAMDLPEAQQGVLVQSVEPGSPAQQAGIQGGTTPDPATGLLLGGDLITAVDGQQVTQPAEIRAILAGHQPGDEVTVTLLRDGQEMEVQVTLAAPTG